MANTVQIIDLKALQERVPLSRIQIWRLEQEGKFPRRIKVSVNRVGWIADEVNAWLAERIAASRPST